MDTITKTLKPWFSRGKSLPSELVLSPTREAPVAFVRLGAIWDAPAGAAIEVATSGDGFSWSPWAPLVVLGVEAEETSSFIGQIAAADGAAFYYRLRAGSEELPTFLQLEFLESTLSEAIEDGLEPDDGIGTTTQALTIGGANVHSRASWGARSPRCVSYHSPYRMTVHHTYTPTNDSLSAQARLRQIQSYHQDVRGWCDIGYQYLVSRDGRLWEGRGAGKRGAHVANQNTGNVGISFIGTHTSTPVTSTQIDNAAALVRGLSDQYGIAITSSKIKGHRDYGGTACPGDALYAQLPTLRDVANGSSPPPPEPPPPDPPPDPPPPDGSVTIKGVIYIGTNTGARIPGATVRLGTRSTTASSSGYYELTNVSPGTFTVTAQAGGYDSGSVTRTASGTETWASIGLWPSAPAGNAGLQGVIYRGTNSFNRIPHATVSLSNGATTTANENGYYLVESLTPGAVTITATAPGHSTDSVSRTLQNGATIWGSVSLD